MLRSRPLQVLIGLYILLFARLSATHTLPMNEFHPARDEVAAGYGSGAKGNGGRALATSLGTSNTLSTRSNLQARSHTIVRPEVKSRSKIYARSDIDARSGHGESLNRARASLSEFPYLVDEPSPVVLCSSSGLSNLRIILDPITSWSYATRHSDWRGPETPFMQDLKRTFAQKMQGTVAGEPQFEISDLWVWGTKDEVPMRNLQTRAEMDKSLAELGRAGQAKRVVIDIKGLRPITYTNEDFIVAIGEFAKAFCGTTTGTAPGLVKRKYTEHLFQIGLKPQDPEREPIDDDTRRNLLNLPKARSYPLIIRRNDDWTNYRIILDKKLTDILSRRDPVVWWKQFSDIFMKQMPRLDSLDLIELQTNQRVYVRWQMKQQATGDFVRYDPVPGVPDAQYRQMPGEEEERIAIDIKNIESENYARIIEFIDAGIKRTVDQFYKAVTRRDSKYTSLWHVPPMGAPDLFSIGSGTIQTSTHHRARSDIELM